MLTEDNDYINLLDDDLSLEQKKRKIESFLTESILKPVCIVMDLMINIKDTLRRNRLNSLMMVTNNEEKVLIYVQAYNAEKH